MKKTIKIICIGVGIMMLSVVLLILSYYWLSFRPYCPQIKSILHASHPLYNSPPDALVNAVALTEKGKGVRNFVARRLLILFNRNNDQRNLRRLIDHTVWTTLFGWYFSDREQLMLWCYFAPYENGMGINESANFHYGRDLDKLHVEEIIALVVRAKSPAYYQKFPDKLEERVKNLLAEYQAAYSNMK